MLWFGNEKLFKKVEFPTALMYVISEKNPQKSQMAAPSDQAAHG
jgi:hypothetical protein